MKANNNINFKALIIGAAIATAFILLGHQFKDWLYPFASVGLLYAGYGQNSIRNGAIIGAVASTPIIVLALKGYLGSFDGFFLTEIGILVMAVIILLVGAFVGFIGAWAKISRLKAYEKKQKIGKNKNKK